MARINPAATRRPESRAAVAAVPRSGKHPGLAQRKTGEACPLAERPVFRPLMGNQDRSRGSVCANPAASRRPEQPRRPCRCSAKQDIAREGTAQPFCASCGLPASENRTAGHDGSLCARCENRIATRALPGESGGTRWLTPSDEPQARLTSGIPVVTNLPGLTVSVPSPQALTGSGGRPERNLLRHDASPLLRKHALQGCVAPGHWGALPASKLNPAGSKSGTVRNLLVRGPRRRSPKKLTPTAD